MMAASKPNPEGSAAVIKRSCCVPGCDSIDVSLGEGISFFTFPSLKIRHSQHVRWLNAINKWNYDGTRWEPNKKSSVCSKHFVNGRPSKDNTNIDYIPTVFDPDPYGSKEFYEIPWKAQKAMEGKGPFLFLETGGQIVESETMDDHIPIREKTDKEASS